jgi:PAS domain S-box-containing protein
MIAGSSLSLVGIKLRWNRWAERLYGYTAQEVLGQSIDILVPPGRQDEVPEILQKISRGENIAQYETVRQRKDGKKILVSLTISPIKDAEERITGASTIARDITDCKRAEEALKQAHDELEQKVNDRTAELRLTVAQLQEEATNRLQTEDSLQESEARLRHLTSQLLTAQEQERKRLALELHDDLGQSLTVLKMQLRAIQRKAPPESSEIRESLEHTLSFINDIIERIRRLSRNLRPAILEDIGLTAALKHLFKEFCQNIQVTMDMDDTKELFSQEAQLNIYRIFQESFSNITKYAQATQVSLRIKRQEGNCGFSGGG